MIKALAKLYWWLFTYFHPALQTLRRNRVRSLLDVGCGTGNPVKMLRCYKVGLDVDLLALKECLKEHRHADLILGDASCLPFRDKSFDAVMCLQVLHFMPKRSGRSAIEEMERLARKIVVLAIPIDTIPEGSKDGWKSSWKPAELISRGYFAKFYGLRFLHRLALRRTGTLCSKFIFSIDPFTHIFQKLLPFCKKHYMVCYKYLRD